MKRFRKLERYLVVYTDYYEVSEEEFKRHFSDWDSFLESEDLEMLDDWKIKTEKDEISNRQGTAEIEWVFDE